ncbi:hypothetical protein BO71DRAFT_487608 [Aspergillus ellipticus CBS 707.79]|uniref:Rhodopsin domain-containing protein n=1 Tax=Aspergillus ellipticus CBS 707.79 TaxID=1448320 RepID=A0A319DP56_9EURO|nr:hypothetical protein BO71DRAFT_487608 [Aspergillus ellipticus CBS 707.79]
MFLCLATVVVALRLYARLHMLRKPGWDDLLIALSLITDFFFFAFLVVEIKYGLAKNQDELQPNELEKQLKALYITIPLYNLCLTLTKLSLIFLYRRLFPPKGYQVLLMVALAVVLVTGMWMVFSAILFCIPVRAFWDTSIPHTCLSQSVVWGLNAALQITTDLALVIIPLPILARLRLPKRQKAALIFIFALGFFVCATSIVRLTTIVKLIHTTNFTEGNGLAATWSFIESNTAIICACLPPLRPLIIRFFPRLIPSRMRSSYHAREKPTVSGLEFLDNPFIPANANASYVASITGNCSGGSNMSRTHTRVDSGVGVGRNLSVGNGDGHHGDGGGGTGGIQIVQELRWDSFSTAVGGGGGPGTVRSEARSDPWVLEEPGVVHLH